MKLIVDTSVTAKWFVIEQDHEKAKSFIGEALVAPDLLLAEVSNVLWKKWRVGEMGRDQSLLAQALVTSFVELLPSSPLADSALKIAMELEHPVYDCFFLALSESSEIPLVTADQRLIRRCDGTRFAEIVRAL